MKKQYVTPKVNRYGDIESITLQKGKDSGKGGSKGGGKGGGKGGS